jgi:hypothetical protein
MSRNNLFLYDDSTFEHEGFTFKVNFPYDTDTGMPWENCDGHGVVSDWTRRDKRPGEVELCSDRGSKRFYDVQESTKIAKRDGWGLSDEHKAELLARLSRSRRVKKVVETVVDNQRHRAIEWEDVILRDPNKPLTDGEVRAESVRRDFKFLEGWCNDQWGYVGVVVKLMLEDEDGELVESDFEDALWGVETYDDYHMEVAYECAGNVLHEYRQHLANEASEAAERSYWEEREVVTV